MSFGIRLVLVMAFSWMMVGCLSLTSRSQVVSLATVPNSSREFRLDDQDLEAESAPAFLEINRERRLVLVDEATRKPFQLECQVRWGEWTVSNLPLIFITVGFPGSVYIAGLLTDWATGSLYDCPDAKIKISPTLAKQAPLECIPTLILNRSELSQEELPILIQRASQKQQILARSCDQRRNPKIRDNFLKRYSLDFDKAESLLTLERQTLNEIGFETQSDRILFISGSNGTFQYELFDLHRKGIVAKGAIEYQPTAETQGIWSQTQKVFQFIPNTVSLGVSTFSLRNTEGVVYNSFGDSSTGFRILLDSVFHPYTRGTFDFYFYFSSPVRFYSFQLEGDPFLDDPRLQEKFSVYEDGKPTTIKLLYLGLAISPAFQLNTPAGQFGMALRFGGGYMDVTSTLEASNAGWQRDWDLSIYYYFFLHRSFLLGLSTSVLYFNQSPIVSEYMNVEGFISGSVYMGYYFGDLRSYF